VLLKGFLFFLHIFYLGFYLFMMSIHKCLDDNCQDEVEQKELSNYDDHYAVYCAKEGHIDVH
jgi:hypothetical protein